MLKINSHSKFDNGLNFIIILLFTMGLLLSAAKGQQIPEWKTVLKDCSFGGSGKVNTLSTKKIQYLASISRDAGLSGINKLFISDDWGHTWFDIKTDPGVNKDEEGNPLPGDWIQRVYTNVERFSENEIIIVVTDQLKDGTDFCNRVLRTTDKGETWTTHNIGEPQSESWPPYISMLDANKGIAMINQYIEEAQEQQRVLFETIDGGQTWKKIDNTPIGFITYIKYLSDSEFVIVWKEGFDDNRKLYHTTDMGLTNTNYLIPDKNAFSYCTYDNKTLYTGIEMKGASSKIKIIKTTDFGENWTVVTDQILDQINGICALDFYDENHGIIVDKVCTIHMTSDGGKTWIRQHIPYEIFQETGRSVLYYQSDKAIVQSVYRLLELTGEMVLQPPALTYTQQHDHTLNYTINWTNIKGAASYRMQMAEFPPSNTPSYYPPNFDSEKILDTTFIYNSGCILRDVMECNKDYYIKIQALGKNSDSDWSRVLYIRTPKDPDGGTLSAPVLIYPNWKNNKDVPTDTIFSWNPVYGAETYSLTIRYQQNSNPNTDIIVSNLEETYYEITGLEPGHEYFWTVMSEAPGKAGTGAGLTNFTTVDDISVTDEISEISGVMLSPNPLSGRGTLCFDLKENSLVELCLYDYEGRMIKKLDRTYRTIGQHDVEINISDLNLHSGQYYLLINIGSKALAITVQVNN